MKMMKKTILSILLSLVMALGLMPGMSLTAYADNYNLWVGDTQVTSENMSDVFSDGKVSYTPAQGETAAKLKLNGYNYEGKGYIDWDNGAYCSIWAGEDLIIELSGTNSIKNTESNSYAIYSGGHLSITGNAVLNVEGTETGIFAQSLTVDGGDITAKGTNQDGIRSEGPIQINNGKVNATSNGSMSSGLSAPDTITINGGSVIADCDAMFGKGISCDQIYINGGNVVASGTTYGIITAYDNKIINKIPGIGWTNREGTEGENAISVSTAGQSLSSYKKVQFQATHTHSFTYSASGATITATCSADGCTLPPSTEGGSDHVSKLTIVKPTLTTYGETGKSEVASLTGLTDFNTATGKTIAATDIKYVGREGTSYAESGTAPTNAGKYTAKITVEGKTATVDYEIDKAQPTTPTGLTAKYGQTLADVTLPTGWSWAQSSQSVGTVGDHTFKANYTPADAVNYYSKVDVDVTVTVGKGTNPATVSDTASVTKGGNTVDLKNNVTLNGATDNVSYAIAGEANGCTLSGSTLTSGNNTGTVTVNVTVAEDDNYNASAAMPITVTINDKQTQTITASDVTAIYGDTGKSISATTNGDGTLSYAVKSGDAVTVDPSSGALTIVKAGTATVTVTATETATYASATKDVTVTINKANAVAATVTANNRTYDGTEKSLVTVTGEATGGEMQYALGENATTAPAENLYTTSIPAKTDAGTYYVWYKVVGDSGHADTTPASVPVTISPKAMTVSATGYTGYPDGKAHGITVTVTDPATGATVKYGEAQGTYNLDASPTLTEAGTKTVYYQITADNYTTATGSATIQIAERITYAAEETSATVAEHTIGNGKDAVLVFHRSVNDAETIAHFRSAAVDGKTLSAGDYSVKSGSLILTLKASYLDTLTPGAHQVTVTFDDGAADTTIQILEAPPTAAPTNVPKTGDGADLGLWLTLILSGLLLLGGWAVYTLRKRG